MRNNQLYSSIEEAQYLRTSIRDTNLDVRSL